MRLLSFKKIMSRVVLAAFTLSLLATAQLTGSAETPAETGYKGANGHTYFDSDFTFQNTDIEPGQLYSGWGRFCIEKPEKYFEGYVMKYTEGDFKSGVEPGSAVYSKNTTCFAYPKKFEQDTKVSVVIYPYIELTSGAKKFLQPGYGSSMVIKNYDDLFAPMDFNLSSEKEGQFNVKWNHLPGQGQDFDKYQLYIYKGGKSPGKAPDYSPKVSWDYYNFVSLEAGSTWDVEIMPVKVVNGEYVAVGQPSVVKTVKVKGVAEVELVPGQPTIYNPHPNQVLTNYPRKAYLSWKAVDGAVNYQIEMACDVCNSLTNKFSNPTYYVTPKNNSSNFTTPPLAGDNEFRFRVRGITANGTYGQWSGYQYFSYDTSAYAQNQENNQEGEVEVKGADKKDLPPAGYEDEVITAWDEYKNPFPDTDMSTIEGKAAAELYRRGIIGGYPDGTFKADKPVNRAEAAKFLLLAKYGNVGEVKNDGLFRDVLDGQWYTSYVVQASKFGIISGYPDGTFKPGNNVNRAEFLKMLTLTFQIQTGLSFNFLDVLSGAWYAQYAGSVAKYDLWPNNPHPSYLQPAEDMTRGEVAVMIYQYLKNK